MQINDFYRGILAEIKQEKVADSESVDAIKAQVTPAFTTNQAAAQTIAQPAATSSAVKNPVFNIGTYTATPQGTNVYNIGKNFLSGQPKYIDQELNNLELATDSDILKSKGNIFNLMGGESRIQNENQSSQVPTPGILDYFTGGVNTADFAAKAYAKNVESLPPGDQAWLASYLPSEVMTPEQIKRYRAAAERITSVMASNQTGSDIVENSLRKFTGNKKNDVASYLLNDPGLGAVASKATMSRAGKLLSSWLSENWGKLALSVGGIGALIMFLNSMQSNDKNTQHYGPQISTGPRFL
jgi:hypothetical protein